MFSQKDWELAQTGDLKIRNKILVAYQPLVERCADKLSKSLPNHVDRDDLASCGQFGLMDAIQKYDPESGFKFETYAYKRIKGAMLDDLRVQDWVPRALRSGERTIDRAHEELVQELGRHPTSDELSGRADFSVREIDKIRGAVTASQIGNIDLPMNDEDGSTIADAIAATPDDTELIFDAADRERILGAIESLASRERVTLALHYYLGYTLAEIGTEFEVTESRVCQIHTAALKEIRAGLHA